MTPLLNTADAVMVGSQSADAVYLGTNEIWTSADPDATAFLTAAAITDPTQSAAIEQLVVDLKAASIWTKLDAIYPFVGGSAAKHKWNLKDPRDVNAAFRLSFSGGWTHDANGVTPDGSSYADTHWSPVAEAAANDGSFGTYCRTQTAGVGGTPYDMGCSSALDTQASICIGLYSSGRFFPCYGTSNYNSVASSDGRAFWATNRLSSTNTEGYKNGTRVLDVSDAVSLANFSMYVGCCNRGGTPSYFSAKNTALIFLGGGMSQAEHAAFYTAVQAFQTALGRQV